MEDTATVTGVEFFTGALVHPRGKIESKTAANKKYFFTALLFTIIYRFVC
jgi:hypothetical protein